MENRRLAAALLSLLLPLALAAMACNAAGIDGAGRQVTPTRYSPPPPPAEPDSDAPAEKASQESPSGIEAYTGEFVDDDCACGEYVPTKVHPWGNSSLSCRYEWSGPNIDNNALGFEVVNYANHEDRLDPAFHQDVEDLTFSSSNQGDDSEIRLLQNDEEGFVFLAYGPGGGGKQGDIPLCGNGRGVFQVAGQILIQTELFACDLPYSDSAYASALSEMETCALRAVQRIK